MSVTFEDYGPFVSGAKPVIDFSFWQWARDANGNLEIPPDYWALAEHADAFVIRAGSNRSDNGLPYTDFTFEANYQGSLGKVDKLGAYWFWRPLNPYGAARYFANLVNGKAFDWVVVDVEVAGSTADLWIFMDELERHLTGSPVIMIYTNPNTWLYLLQGSKARAIEYEPAIAHYNQDIPQELEPWASAGISPAWHQFTDEGPGAGQGWGIPAGASTGLDLGWAHPRLWEEPPEPPPPPPLPERVVVNPGIYLNVRTEPVTSASTRIGSVYGGTEFELAGAVNGGPWLKVIAYLHGDYVIPLDNG